MLKCAGVRAYYERNSLNEGMDACPPSPTPLPSAASSSSARNLRRQTSRTFDSLTGAKGKGKAGLKKLASDSDFASTAGIPQGSPLAPAALASLPLTAVVLPSSTLATYAHVGLAPPVTGETAAKFRTRVTDNETKALLYTTSLERSATTYNHETNKRLTELATLVRELKGSVDLINPQVPASVSPLADPHFAKVYKAVGENRTEIQKLLSSMDGLSGMASQVAALRKELACSRASNEAANELVATRTAIVTPHSLAPFAPFAPAAPALISPLVVPNNGLTIMNHEPAGFPRREQRAPLPRPAKRPRPNDDANDVVYGPVGIGGNPLHMGRAAVSLERGQLTISDVKSVQTLHGRPNMLSIRFYSHEKALAFISFVQRSPPLPNQHASLKDDGFRNDGGGTTSALELLRGADETAGALNMLRGNGQSSR